MSVQRTRVWCRFVLAAAISSVIGGVASAQTLIVRGVPAGSSVELVINSNAAGKGTADTRGDAKIPVDLTAHAGKPEMDAHVYAETCGDVRRVYVVERGLQPPVRADECDRRDITGVFFVRRINTLVVNMAGANPTLLLVSGSYNLNPKDPTKIVTAKRTGIVIFGGGGFSKLRDIEFVACGDVADCSGNGWTPTASVGAEVWFKPFLAAQFSYVKPAQVTMTGDGGSFRFTSEQDTNIVAVAGKVGIPVGRVRIFGQYGWNFSWVKFTTDQTVDDVTTTTEDGVVLTAQGGRQTFELKTDGWAWSIAGGVEVWLTRRFGIYGEASRIRLKGTAADEGEGSSSDYMTLLVGGARFRFGGR